MLPDFMNLQADSIENPLRGNPQARLSSRSGFYIMFSKISIFLESAVRVTIAFLMSERLPT